MQRCRVSSVGGGGTSVAVSVATAAPVFHADDSSSLPTGFVSAELAATPALTPTTPDGESDVGGVAARVYDALRSRLAGVDIDLALAGDAVSLNPLRARAETDANLILHVNATDVVALMGRADAAIGAGGGSTWERACLGLPTLAVIVAENQRETIERLTQDGVLLSVSLDDPDFEEALNGAFDRLSDAAIRANLANGAARLCDGQGADRAAEALLARIARKAG